MYRVFDPVSSFEVEDRDIAHLHKLRLKRVLCGAIFANLIPNAQKPTPDIDIEKHLLISSNIRFRVRDA